MGNGHSLRKGTMGRNRTRARKSPSPPHGRSTVVLQSQVRQRGHGNDGVSHPRTLSGFIFEAYPQKGCSPLHYCRTSCRGTAYTATRVGEVVSDDARASVPNIYPMGRPTVGTGRGPAIASSCQTHSIGIHIGGAARIIRRSALRWADALKWVSVTPQKRKETPP